MCFRSINATGAYHGLGARRECDRGCDDESAARRRPNLAEAMNHLRLIHPDLDFRMKVRLRKVDGRGPAVAGSLRRG